MNPRERRELARLLPSPGEPVLSSERLTQLETHLIHEITRQSPEGGTRLTEDRPSAWRMRRRFATIALPAGIAAAAMSVVLTVGSGSERPSPDPEAVDLLNRIAVAAAAQDAPTVSDDQYVFIRTQGTQKIMDEGTDIFRRSDWLPVDGKRDGLARITVLSGPSGQGTIDMKLTYDPHTTTYRELQALPTDTDGLYRWIWTATEGQGPSHEEAALEMIGSMLTGATLLPEVDAALYRVAAKIPGVRVVEDAKDAAGRTGVGLAFGDRGERRVWVFGAKTLAYLGSDEVALLDIGVVQKVGETRAG
ncbi:CU044_5270 family protein [Streptomyces olivaceoviridis]|uniref:CU044_5270 family protein n=1 Tax=Streptomyces olivaceoviridis TaxID=1921 RepID=UPI0036B5F445